MSEAHDASIFRRPDLSLNKLSVPVPTPTGGSAPIAEQNVSFPETAAAAPVAAMVPEALPAAHPGAMPTPVPPPVANANPVAAAIEQVAPRNAAFVVARTYEGRIAPAKPWSARIQLVEASRVGIQVTADLGTDFTVSFTGTRGKQSGRPIFAPVDAPQSDQPSWFRVPAGVTQVNIGFRGNDAHHASVTIWLPSEVAGTPATKAA